MTHEVYTLSRQELENMLDRQARLIADHEGFSMERARLWGHSFNELVLRGVGLKETPKPDEAVGPPHVVRPVMFGTHWGDVRASKLTSDYMDKHHPTWRWEKFRFNDRTKRDDRFVKKLHRAAMVLAEIRKDMGVPPGEI